MVSKNQLPYPLALITLFRCRDIFFCPILNLHSGLNQVFKTAIFQLYPMKKFIVTLVILALPFSYSVAQFGSSFRFADWYGTRAYFEGGIAPGIMNCKTDIADEGLRIYPQGFRPSITLYAGVVHTKGYGVRVEYTSGTVTAADSFIRRVDKDSAKLRNLNFKSKINEFALIGEVYPLTLRDGGRTQRFVNPYLFAGIGFFRFNPQTHFQGRLIDLKPLSINGHGFPEYPDRKPYDLTAICIPFGAGVKLDVNKFLNIGAELNLRYTFTDHLDDVSEARTDTDLYSKYLPQEQADLAKLLYIRRWEIDPTSDKQTGPRGNPARDSYYTFNVKLGLCFTKAYDCFMKALR